MPVRSLVGVLILFQAPLATHGLKNHSAHQPVTGSTFLAARQVPLERQPVEESHENPVTVQDYLLLNSWEIVLFIVLWAAITVACAYYFHTQRQLPDADPDLSTEAERNRLTQWSHGLFGCANDPQVFAMACCCPAIRWAHTMELVGIFTFWAGFAIFFSLSVLNAFTAGMVVWLLLAGFCAYYRQLFRKTFDMESGGLTIGTDCLSYFCCAPCAITQEAMHVDAAATCNHKAVNRPALEAQGVTMTPRAAIKKQ